MDPKDKINIIVGILMIPAALFGGYIRKKLDNKFGLTYPSDRLRRKNVIQALKKLHVIRLIIKTLGCVVVSIMVYSALKTYPVTITVLVLALGVINYFNMVKKGAVCSDAGTELENIIVAMLTMLLSGFYIYNDLTV